MRRTIGLALAAGSLVGCSGGALDIGDGDGGDDRSAAPVAEVSVFSKAAVEGAHQRCTVAMGNSASTYETLNGRYTVYGQPALRSYLVGGWLPCYGRYPDEDGVSLQFTADGHWYALVDDGDGGLKRGQVRGYAGGQIGYDGTYTFRDDMNRPSGPDGGAVYVATGVARWFHPEFVGSLMSMNVATDGAYVTCVAIDR